MLLRQVHTPVEQLQQFERGRIAGLQEAGWTYRRIATHVGYNVSVVCCYFQQWSMKYSHTCTIAPKLLYGRKECDLATLLTPLVIHTLLYSCK